MGYRSEVYIAVPKKDEAQLDAIMRKHELLEDDHPSFIKKNNKEQVVYHGDYLKWYESFEGVDAVNSFIQSKPYNSSDNSGRTIVCVGEDNEVWGIGDYHEVFNVYTKVELI